MKEMIIGILMEFAPVITGLLTVLAMKGLKFFIVAMDNLPAWAQQLAVAAIAVVLTHLGAFINVVLPTDVVLLTAAHLESVMAAGIAMAAHAGLKAKGNS